jgi:hypothetical protein
MPARQVLQNLSHSTSPFLLWLNRISLYAWAILNHDSVLPCSSWDDRRVPLHPVIGWDAVLWMFLLWLTLNCDPLNLSLPSS